MTRLPLRCTTLLAVTTLLGACYELDTSLNLRYPCMSHDQCAKGYKCQGFALAQDICPAMGDISYTCDIKYLNNPQDPNAAYVGSVSFWVESAPPSGTCNFQRADAGDPAVPDNAVDILSYKDGCYMTPVFPFCVEESIIVCGNNGDGTERNEPLYDEMGKKRMCVLKEPLTPGTSSLLVVMEQDIPTYVNGTCCGSQENPASDCYEKSCDYVISHAIGDADPLVASWSCPSLP